MGLVASEFGEDLDAIRQSKDFDGRSLAILINALKNGSNIFDAEQRRILLEGKDIPSLEL
jgi:ribosome assembly protein 3